MRAIAEYKQITGILNKQAAKAMMHQVWLFIICKCNGLIFFPIAEFRKLKNEDIEKCYYTC